MTQQVSAHHLSRLAYLYVRQSTLQQVLENTESTARQYALRERALALGWSQERIVVIDQDLGHSGASTADRLGFQRLVAEVGGFCHPSSIIACLLFRTHSLVYHDEVISHW